MLLLFGTVFSFSLSQFYYTCLLTFSRYYSPCLFASSVSLCLTFFCNFLLFFQIIVSLSRLSTYFSLSLLLVNTSLNILVSIIFSLYRSSSPCPDCLLLVAIVGALLCVSSPSHDILLLVSLNHVTFSTLTVIIFYWSWYYSSCPSSILLFLIQLLLLVAIFDALLLVVIALILPLLWWFWSTISNTKTMTRGQLQKS